MRLSIRKAQKPESKETNRRSFTDTYLKFSYRVFGKRYDKEGGKADELSDKLKQASLELTPSLFRSLRTMTVLIVSCATLAADLLVLGLVVRSAEWYVMAALVTGVSAGAAVLIFQLVPASRASNRRVQIDRELPFTLSELSVLASTGLSPVKIIRRIAKRTKNPSMANELKKVVFKMDIEGKDLIAALGETAKESPSRALRETLWDLANLIHQGGDLDVHLRVKADQTLQLKRDVQREFIEKLAQYSDAYISLVLIGVLFISIMAFLLDVMGSSVAGLDGSSLLLMLTFLVIPAAAMSIGVMVSSAHSRRD